MCLLGWETFWLDMLVFVVFDSLADRARFDKLFDVLPKVWPNVSVSGHLDGLLLSCMHVFMKCFDSCLPVCWWQEKDGAGSNLRWVGFSQQLAPLRPGSDDSLSGLPGGPSHSNVSWQDGADLVCFFSPRRVGKGSCRGGSQWAS